MAHASLAAAASLGIWLSLIPLTSSAAPNPPQRTLYLQTSTGSSHSQGRVIGATLPGPLQTMQVGSGALNLHWDLWLGSWKNQKRQEKSFDSFVAGFGPNLRWRDHNGSSPWFVEGGVGLMYTHTTLFYRCKPMGSHWNFTPQIAIGYNLGAQRQHEVSLRIFHASNAGLKQPNPGLNFAQLRYAYAF